MNALILGGSRGIGKATSLLLQNNGWFVSAYGRLEYDVVNTAHSHIFKLMQDARVIGKYDAFVYSAGDLTVTGIDAFKYPLAFYCLITEQGYHLFNNGCKIIAISSVAAERPAKVNPHYASAKAALESYVRTLADSKMAKRSSWSVETIRFDLVHTAMLDKLPGPIDMTSREYITSEVAAQRIVVLLGVD